VNVRRTAARGARGPAAHWLPGEWATVNRRVAQRVGFRSSAGCAEQPGRAWQNPRWPSPCSSAGPRPSARRDARTARRFFEQAIGTTKVTPVEVTTDQAPAYPGVLEALLPAAWHRTDQYANNRVECDHGRRKARLRPMRGLKQDRSARVIVAGHALVQNLRRGHDELAERNSAGRTGRAVALPGLHRDAKFCRNFDAVFSSAGGEILLTPVRAPNVNAYAKRWVRTVRAECLDWLLIVGRGHLERVLRVYLRHYNRHRPHRALMLQAPDLPARLAILGEDDQDSAVHRGDLLGGLLHEYRRAA
jgi:transposase InsO family protein